MLGSWMLYSVLVSGLTVVAFATCQGAVPRHRRLFWVGALASGAAAPLAVPRLKELWPASSALDVTLGELVPVVGRLGAATPTAGGGGLSPGSVLLGLWIGASLLLVAALVAGAWRVRLLGRGWRPATLDGVEVLVSCDVGPAVVGVARPRIVVPEWVVELPRSERALVLAHEEEHRRSGDPALLAAALALPLAFPWNPALWWGFRRLRDAVETDCDQRVLATGARDPGSYARLLLDVGARSVGAVPLGAGFGARRSSLERRIRTMIAPTPTTRPAVLGRIALACALLTAACTLEVEIHLDDDAAEALGEAVVRNAAEAGVDVTVVTTRGPEEADPAPPARPLVGAVGAGARAPASQGRPEASRPIPERPPALSPPALPARSASTPRERRAAQEPPPADIGERPTFTPFTVAPAIQNRTEVIAAMEREYPPLLRDAGIGGTVHLYFFVDEEGVARDVRLNRSSGHAALDQAALRVAQTYRFSPARNRDREVPVWVSFPITFAVR